jgi:hypothetical protein
MTKTTLPAKRAATTTALAVSAEDDFFGSRAGEGLENVGASDMLVPRLSILQALSPQLNSRKPEYIEGAQIGDVADVGTGDLFKGPILFLPVYYRKDYIEWAPRSSGKGLVAIHNDASILDQCTRNEKKQPVLPNGNYVAETAQFFGFNLSTPDRRRCFIPMASTQLSKARKWITLAVSEKVRRSDGSEYTPPLFYRAYELTTAMASNSEGEWGSWVVNRGPSLPEIDLGIPWQQLGHEAVAFRDMLTSGAMRGDVASMNAENAAAEEVM